MIKKSKEKNKKSTLILGLMAVLLLFVLGISWVVSYNNKLTEKVKNSRQKIKKFVEEVEKKDYVQTRLEYLQNTRAAFDERLLAGDTPAVAAAELQNVLNDMASELELMISSERIINPKERGIFQEIPVQIVTQCTITKLKELLYQIETYPKFLSITNLDIQVVRNRDPKDVRATIDVSGFILNKPGTSPKT